MPVSNDIPTPASPSKDSWIRRLILAALGTSRPALVTMLLMGVCLCPVGLQITFGQAAAAIDREYAIKGVFLYHFLTYVTWPEETFPTATDPYVIGVLQEDPFGPVLERIAATKTVSGRPIVVRRLSSAEESVHCHLVFVGHGVDAHAQDSALKLLANARVLSVGESESFVAMGGTAYFFIEAQKVRFAFDMANVARSELKISSKLLSLAKIIPAP